MAAMLDDTAQRTEPGLHACPCASSLLRRCRQAFCIFNARTALFETLPKNESIQQALRLLLIGIMLN